MTPGLYYCLLGLLAVCYCIKRWTKPEEAPSYRRVYAHGIEEAKALLMQKASEDRGIDAKHLQVRATGERTKSFAFAHPIGLSDYRGIELCVYADSVGFYLHRLSLIEGIEGALAIKRAEAKTFYESLSDDEQQEAMIAVLSRGAE